MEATAKRPCAGMTKENRAVFLDLLKAVAMIAVVFYHAGFQPYGYLGVDIFFVVSGFLTVRSMPDRIFAGRFSYFAFLKKQLLRLWPLVLLGSLVCLVAGFFTMLPDDYENLAESVVASNCFANNILACITTGDYWDVVNDYKPLMHMWYLGVLMQAFVLLPLIPLAVKRLARQSAPRRLCGLAFAALALLSFVLCLSGAFSEEQRFYYVPFRLFEILLGAVVACAIPAIEGCQRLRKGAAAALSVLSLLLLSLLLLCPLRLGSAFLRLVCVCLLAASAVAFSLRAEDAFSAAPLKAVSSVGRCTLSIFVWHQILLAFYRYSVKSTLSAPALSGYLALLAVVSVLSWRFLEQPLRKLVSEKRGERLVLVCCCALFVLTTAAGLLLYVRAGVTRDIAELDVDAQNAHRHMHAEYCDRVYDYDRDFTDSDTVKVLVIGNSFARDWANILLESELCERLEISYLFSDSNADPINSPSRLERADRIFYAFSGGDYALPAYLQPYYEQGKVYFVGNKNFGDNNGQIYARRFRSDYFDSAVRLPDGYIRQNNLLKELYGERFVDMIGAVLREDGTVKVFSPAHKFISQDGRHLTRGGAQYYASLLDLQRLVAASS